MPSPYQIIPQGSLFRPKIETHINNNSIVDTTAGITGGGTITSAICVFISPKGRDNEILTIDQGLPQFLKEYGIGSFSVYGQPLLNAYNAVAAAAVSGGMVHCMRVTADDAAYSNVTVFAKYKVVTVTDEEDESGEPTVTHKELHVQFIMKTSDEPLTQLSELGDSATTPISPDDLGWSYLKLFAIAYRGRGTYGKNIHFRVTTNKGMDKMVDYRTYNFEVYRQEEVLSLDESFSVTTVDGSVSGNTSIFIDDVVNDPINGSGIVKMVTFDESFQALYDTYVDEIDPDTTFTRNDFDVLLGQDKYSRYNSIPNYFIDPVGEVIVDPGQVPISLTTTGGIALLGGSEGSLASGSTNRAAVLKDLYLRAFNGQIDERIKSRFQFPTTFIYDANYPIEVKMAIASLTRIREDNFATLDFGTEIYTRDSVKAYYETNFEGMIDDWHVAFEPYCMKMVDPYSHKTVTVTSTAWMIGAYFRHIAIWSGKHRPMAGNRFGVITGIIANSVYPVFDETLHAELMDELADDRCNVAKFNQNQIVVRSMQNTTDHNLSSLTEENNCLLVLDVRRDAESLVANYEYDFMERSDIARFNAALTGILNRYAGTQLRSITGHFDRNQWEAERSILHLYIELVCKDLVKTIIIEIDVNRSED